MSEELNLEPIKSRLQWHIDFRGAKDDPKWLSQSDQDIYALLAEVERLRAALGSRGVPQDLSAGDLLIDASNKFAEHAEICNLDDCSECTVRINQLRLARKVWQSSAHKSAALPSSPAEKAGQ